MVAASNTASSSYSVVPSRGPTASSALGPSLTPCLSECRRKMARNAVVFAVLQYKEVDGSMRAWMGALQR